MKANLTLQEGPGAGHSYPLDPAQQKSLSVGRSSECTIVLMDHRASRHHADIRWNGRSWEVADRGSTNGTYVNGLRVHQPYDLQLGDRVTIGETTLVLREPAGPPQASAYGPPPRAAARPMPRVSAQEPAPSSVGAGVAFWAAAVLIALAVVCLATGAFLPWLRVTGSLSQELSPLIQGVTDIISSIMGPDSFLHVTQEIGGLEGYGKLTLGVAVVSLLTLAVDLFVGRRSWVPPIVYLLSGLAAAGAMASDLLNFYQLYKQVESWSVLFGIQLGEMVQFLDKFIEMQVTPLIGLPLTVGGLGLLLAGAVVRLSAALLEWNHRR